MATIYYGVKLSGNVTETPEGYLVFKNAVIARTGFQSYKGSELDAEEVAALGIDIKPDDMVDVYRMPEEVFSKRTISSFEGKPVTDQHQGMVDIDSHSELSEGHVQNVRPGTEPLESGDMPLLGDVYVTSANLIAKWRAGIRELSCGYNYHLAKSGDHILQVDITGNHVAFVENGRAGIHVKVNDSIPQEKEKFTMSNFLKEIRKRGFVAWATDAKPEQIATAFDEMCEETEKDKPAADAGAADKAAADKAAARDRMHKALDKHMDAKDNAAEEQAANDDADMKELTAILQTPSQAASLEAGATDESAEEEEEENEAETEDSDEDGEEGEDEAVQTNPSPEIAAGERSANPLPSAVDSAYKAGQQSVLKAMKPFVARAKNKALIGAFDNANKIANKKAVRGQGSYAAVGRAAATATDSIGVGIDKEAKLSATAEAAYAVAREAKRKGLPTR